MIETGRRDFILGLAAGAVWVATGGAARAADWRPAREIELVVPNSAGGGNDLLGRAIAKIMSDEKLVPTPVVVSNRPGGAQAVGMGYVATTKQGDPHTLAIISTGSQVTPLTVRNAKGVRDVQPIAILTVDDFFLVVRAQSNYTSAAQMVEAAKARPRSISIGIGGATDEMAVAVLESATGVKFNIVRFGGTGEAVTAVLGGHVDATTGNPIELLSQIQGGAIRGVAVFRPTRFPVAPDVPTLAEQGINAPAYQAWRGIAMAPGAPAEAVAYWRDVVRRLSETATFKQFVEANVATPQVLMGDALTRYLDEQEELYKRLIAR